MTRLATIQRQRADLAQRAIDAKSRRQGTKPLLKLAHDLTIEELRLTVKRGKRK